MTNFDYEKIELTHATVKKDGQNIKVSIYLGQLGANHLSPTYGWTQVYTPSGIFPVLETDEQIQKIIIDKLNSYNNIVVVPNKEKKKDGV